MPRRSYKRQPVSIDPLYQCDEVSKLINYIMVDGKRSVSERIVYATMERFSKEGKDPVRILRDAIQNVAPKHEVKPRRLGGASYLVPIEVRAERKIYLALNWIINAAKTRPNKEYKTFIEKLYAELKEASQNQGQAVSKKLQTEKLADSNKAFSHLKW